MKTIGRPEIESLVQGEKWPAISIYMPVSRVGDPQDSLRYKNFLTQVETRLVNEGMRTTEARSLLEQEYNLASEIGYWRQLGADGLAVFLSGQTVLRYPLPVAFQELVMVGRRFHVRPLLPLLIGGRYLILAVSRNHLQLFQGDRYQVKEIDLPADTPKSMADALQYEQEQRLQYHTKIASAGGQRAAVFHGHGAGVDDQNEHLERYFQIIDRTLFPLLENKECPVVLAGTEELQAVYRRITRSHTILSQGIAGNISDLAAEVLHLKSWEIALDYFSAEERMAVQRFRDNLDGGRVIDDLQSVLTAAFDGRVEDLFVAEHEQVWGIFDSDRRQVVVKKQEDEDKRVVELLDEAVYWTFCKKGTVYVRKRHDMPGNSIICARLRY